MASSLRVHTIGIVLLLFSWASAQEGDQAALELVQGAPLEAVVTVTRHPIGGADMVMVTPLSTSVTAEELRAKCVKIGELTGDPARGIQIYLTRLGDSDKLKFLKATFATSGLIRRDTGEYRLDTLARALGGGPDGWSSFQISLPGETPNAQTIRTYASPAVAVVGTYIQVPATMEYRIRLFTHDEKAIVIPTRLADVAPVKSKPTSQPRRTNWPLVVLIGIASVAAGVLVYCRLLLVAMRKSK